MYRLLKRSLCVFVLLITILFGCRVNALPNSISKINKNEVLLFNDNDRLYYKTYSDGVVFCTDFHTSDVGDSCSIANTQWSLPTQAGVAAIINKYNSKTNKHNYYYAELAINEFLYYFETKDSVNKISTTRDVRNTKGVKGYYNAAVNAYNDASKKFEVRVNTESGVLTFKLEDDYYVSNKLIVSGTNNYEVALSGVEGLEVFDKNGDSFYVKFPSKNISDGTSVDVKVAIKGSKSIDVAKKYACGKNKQGITINKVENVNVNGSDVISGNVTKGKTITKLKISKQDINTKQELSGATLVLKNSLGMEIDRWITDGNPHYIEGLDNGTYTLSEEKAPSGYKLNEDIIEFTLENDGDVKEVVMFNMHINKFKVKISKQDITTKKELIGATLLLSDSNGNEIARWVTDGTPHYIELEKGDYVLTEIQAPTGYDLSYEVIKFSVGEDTEVDSSIIMYNSKTPNTADRNIVTMFIIIIISCLGVGYSVYKLKLKKQD